MSRLLFRSVHGHKMNVADPDILTQSFSKSGYGAVRVTKTNPLCMLSALIREGEKIQVTSSRFSYIFYMAEFGSMVTPADRGRKASIWLCQSLKWEVLWEEGRLTIFVG